MQRTSLWGKEPRAVKLEISGVEATCLSAVKGEDMHEDGVAV